jgi:hypothetical protein
MINPDNLCVGPHCSCPAQLRLIMLHAPAQLRLSAFAWLAIINSIQPKREA